MELLTTGFTRPKDGDDAPAGDEGGTGGGIASNGTRSSGAEATPKSTPGCSRAQPAMGMR